MAKRKHRKKHKRQSRRIIQTVDLTAPVIEVPTGWEITLKDSKTVISDRHLQAIKDFGWARFAKTVSKDDAPSEGSTAFGARAFAPRTLSSLRR